MTYVGAVPTTGDFKVLDSITTSSATTFNLRQGGVAVYPQSSSHVLCVLNGILQTGGSSFNIVNDTIVFSSSLASTDVINQILVLGNVNDIGVPSDDTVSTAKLQSSAVTDAKISAMASSKLTGVVPTANLGSGTASSSTILYGDQTYKTAPNTAGLVKIAESYSASAVGEVDFNDKFTSSYSMYRVVGLLALANSGANLQFRYKTDSSTQLTASNYQHILNGRRITSSAEEEAHSGDWDGSAFTLAFGVNNGSTLPVAIDIVIYDPRQTTFSYKLFHGHVTYYGSDSKMYHHTLGGRYDASGDATGIRLMASAGDINRNDVVLYGLEGTGN